MARRPRWTEADIVRLEALLHQGLSYEDIAAQFSRTPKAIEQIVFKHGLATLRPNRYWNPQDRATARTMLAQGADAATIARHLGRSVAIVEHISRVLAAGYRVPVLASPVDDPCLTVMT